MQKNKQNVKKQTQNNTYILRQNFKTKLNKRETKFLPIKQKRIRDKTRKTLKFVINCLAVTKRNKQKRGKQNENILKPLINISQDC